MNTSRCGHLGNTSSCVINKSRFGLLGNASNVFNDYIRVWTQIVDLDSDYK